MLNIRTVVLSTNRAMSSLTLKSVVTELNKRAPLSLAEPWDNVGLLVEPPSQPIVRHILLTNDLTESVMKEAIDSNVNLIYSYHPPIFASLKRITSSTWKVIINDLSHYFYHRLIINFIVVNYAQERIVGLCLENKIAVYSPHTALDALKGGVNDWLAEAFGKN